MSGSRGSLQGSSTIALLSFSPPPGNGPVNRIRVAGIGRAPLSGNHAWWSVLICFLKNTFFWEGLLEKRI